MEIFNKKKCDLHALMIVTVVLKSTLQSGTNNPHRSIEVAA
jgi:hypothetical protein